MFPLDIDVEDVIDDWDEGVDISEQERMDAIRLNELSNPDILLIPSDQDDCVRLARCWEQFGMGKFQLHYDRHGRPPTCEEDSKENQRSREIRNRVWKVWKKSGLDRAIFGEVVDRAKKIGEAKRLGFASHSAVWNSGSRAEPEPQQANPDALDDVGVQVTMAEPEAGEDGVDTQNQGER